MNLDEVDLADNDRFQRNEGWPQFDTLRREDPVHWKIGRASCRERV